MASLSDEGTIRRLGKFEGTSLATIYKLVKVILVLGAVFLGAIFALFNNHPVRLNFLFFESPSLSLGFWLIVFLFLGSILGLGSSSIILIRYKRLITKLKKKSLE
ncbi:MAG: LapA family protein [Cellvibrionales bacterium TMED148]|nr:hypothetical protein [Porticoccaceae bacterium]RPG90996.1 MAG: LapA family protein [Cellvibrionales bacterium TMED148]